MSRNDNNYRIDDTASGPAKHYLRSVHLMLDAEQHDHALRQLRNLLPESAAAQARSVQWALKRLELAGY